MMKKKYEKKELSLKRKGWIFFYIYTQCGSEQRRTKSTQQVEIWKSKV